MVERNERTIFERKVSLINTPSPVIRLKNLEKKIGFRGSIWMKNDGVISSIYGGNKPRKFEFIFKEAIEKKAKYLVTTGGIGTNHGLAVSLFGKEFGLKTILFLYPQPITEYVKRNLVRMVDSGAEIRLTSHPVNAVLRAKILGRKEGYFFIPPGGSSATGNLGFYLAGKELIEQIRNEELPEPSFVFIPVGTGGSLAGLSLGLCESKIKIIGICVVERPVTNRAVLFGEILSLSNFLRKNGVKSNPLKAVRKFSLNHRFIGKGYGHPTDEAVEAVKIMMDEEGIELETTYTGKTMAGLIHFAREKGKGNILFWNTHNLNEPDIPDLEKKFEDVAEWLGIWTEES
jgi:D-cysteine desulfhydrase